MDLITPTWTTELGASPSGPMSAGGDLLLVSTQGPSQPSLHGALHALNLADGSLRWWQRFEYTLVSGVAVAERNLVFSKNQVSEASEVLILVALSSTDLMRGEGALLALNAVGGVGWRWSLETGLQRVSAPVMGGGAVCFTADAQTFVALDPATGAELARARLGASAALSAPAWEKGVAYIPCRSPHLLAVGLPDGHLRWRFELKDAPETAWLDKTPLVIGEQVFAALSTGAVLALQTGDGSLAWRANVGPADKRLSPPAGDGERLYVGARDGLHALALADGRELWTFPTSRRIEAAPVMVGGVVYVACYDHHLYALDAASGEELWRYRVGPRRLEIPPLVTIRPDPAQPDRASLYILAANRDGGLAAIARLLSAEEHEAAGHWLGAARAYAGRGQVARGVQLLETHGELLEAARLWEAAGELERAASQYEAAGAWVQAARLWGALGRWLKQAQSLEGHARSLGEGPFLNGATHSPAERVEAWQAAARAFEAEGEIERATACRREVAKVLRQPVITMNVEHEGLVLNAWSRLLFTVQNEGYSPAHRLIIRAQGAQFEGQVAVTREISTLNPGRRRVDRLDVCPRAYGDNVPLRVTVQYKDEEEQAQTCRQTLYLPVARTQADRGEAQSIHINMSGGVAIVGSTVSASGDIVGRDKQEVDEDVVGGDKVGGDKHETCLDGSLDVTRKMAPRPESEEGGISPGDLRRRLNLLFDDPGLDAFCMDNFPQVYDKFGRGMRKDEKISLLLDHFRRGGTFAPLLVALSARESALDAGSLEPTLVLREKLLGPASTSPPISPPSPATSNPFGDRGRINDPARFFDRERIVRELRQMLAAGNSVSLVGESEVGKSSLLYHLYATCQDWLPGARVLYLDAQGLLDEADFCAEVLEGLGQEPGDLRALKRALRREGMVLLLDEVEKLANPAFSPQLHDLLRALAQEPTLTLAVASHRPLAEVFPPHSATSPFHNIFTEKRLEPFSLAEARAFLEARLAETGVSFGPEELERLAVESGGHPARLQGLAYELFEGKRGG